MAQARCIFASEIKNGCDMKNTDYCLETLGNMISSTISLTLDANIFNDISTMNIFVINISLTNDIDIFFI